jgi:pimeloyl-ACP methyl ester carboxylesterase
MDRGGAPVSPRSLDSNSEISLPLPLLHGAIHDPRYINNQENDPIVMFEEVPMQIMLPAILLPLPLLLFACAGEGTDAMREVSFKTADGGRIFANLYGQAKHGVVLAHGKVFNKDSWEPFATELSEKNFQVLAIDFRGYGKSQPGTQGRVFHEDVLAAVQYLRKEGAEKVSIIGGSMGGLAALEAALRTRPGEIHKLILLSPVPIDEPEKARADDILFIASEEEGLRPQIEAQFEKTQGSKELKILEGGAHAQHIFNTDQGDALKKLILDFLKG